MTAKFKFTLGVFIITAGIVMGLLNAQTTSPVFGGLFGAREAELEPGDFFTVVDQDHETIDLLGHMVVPGDEIITGEGKRYRIEKTRDRTAYARLLGIDRDVLAWEAYFERATIPVGALGPRRDVGIYHTHSDESYVPTDGTHSIPYRGSIMKVGGRLSNKLTDHGTRTIHDVTPHDPHDAAAYLRSRKTATRMLRQNPIALFDVHRDGIPDPDFYRQQVAGVDIGQIRMVIGRQNPRMSSNLDFAKRLMTYTNKVYPNTVKGIFMGRGSFNQDLMSTALLLECGTYTITRHEAERGVALLADSVPVVLGLTDPGPGFPGIARPIAGRDAASPGAWQALAWILAAAVVGVGGYLVISAGSWEKAIARLKGFWGREMNVLGRGRRNGGNKS
jgi:stage II sporulation protein P